MPLIIRSDIITIISRSSYAVDCNRTCPLAQLGPDDIARVSTSQLSITNWRASVTILLLCSMGVYAEHTALRDDKDIIIYDNMVASGADGNKCL